MTSAAIQYADPVSPPLVVKSATPSDVNRIVSAVVMAFSDDAVARWLYPDPAMYLRHFPVFVKAFCINASMHKAAYPVEGFATGALWLPPGILPDEAAVANLLDRTMPPEIRDEVFDVFDQIGRFHPSDSHWYLPMIGSGLPLQRRGYGSVLLEQVIENCDRDNICAFLESSNPANISGYQRHGFELLGTIQVGSSPPVFPMLREPRRSTKCGAD